MMTNFCMNASFSGGYAPADVIALTPCMRGTRRQPYGHARRADYLSRDIFEAFVNWTERPIV
jgi:hypothetical protein